MTRPPKIVVLGAGSAIFGLGALARIIQTERLRDAELAMVDIDAEALEMMHAVAEKMNIAWGAGMTITRTTDRTKALPGMGDPRRFPGRIRGISAAVRARESVCGLKVTGWMSRKAVSWWKIT